MDDRSMGRQLADALRISLGYSFICLADIYKGTH